MKSLKLTSAAIFLAAIALTSCTEENMAIQGEGPIISTTLSLSDFSEIDLAGASNVTISYGAVQEVVATGHANIIDHVNTDVSSNNWKATLVRGRYRNYELSYHVTLPLLESATISGSGNIYINDFMDQGDLNLSIPGSGNIDINKFEGPANITARISGSGNIAAYEDIASLQSVDIKVSGSGNFEAYPLTTDDCKINIGGSGNCYVNVREQLDVTIGGSGSVRYKGNPAVNTKLTASGTVTNAN